ncbi:rhodanese-related sulfurtransferase [Cryobacterium sp. PH31-L1]|uniref:oxygen-dependent tRNA uridine(34) hydroxylase TrhO n=1 Tax=Cryobacterium sp. PH31-L1 TaxID=3046199 RepID=UPI0024BA001B|nr:rhodanese-related sulfurtransferase [Cryobacterium sp. PH31-L1]MDJ0377520.1 rhodanese-related sulfurtransferase [Cryobacterium sp. PH31-L1]
MAIPKILLFYIFTPLADPDAVRLWQRDLCAGLGLRGRILISKDGLNGTVGGDLPAIKKYIRKTRDYPAFKQIDFKFSEGTGLDSSGHSLDFPKLVVKVREEIVSFGAPGELRVDTAGVVGGGTKLQPAELNALVADRGDEVVFFDGRNRFEAEIGHFPGAVVPDVANTREFVAELDSGKYDHLKGKPVVTYCTGGIRCEVLSGLMKSRGFGEVYQLDGGIVRYGEAFGNEGLWSGSLYVFDQRMSIDFATGAAVLGTCQECGQATTNMLNCRDASCREQLVACPDCVTREAPACAAHA